MAQQGLPNSGKGEGFPASETVTTNPVFEMPPPAYPGFENQQAAATPVGWAPPTAPNPTHLPYSTTTSVTVQPAQLAYQAQPGTHVVIIQGGCPRCRVGTLTDDFDCCAIFLAIFFFPIGILCCLAMRQKRCTNCGAIV